MKKNPFLSSHRRKSRKNHFTAPSDVRRVIMSSNLSKELRQKYLIKSLPIRKDDEVIVMRGHFKSQQPARVLGVYRKKYVIYVERCQREKANGATVSVGIHPSNVQISKLKIDKNRKNLLDRIATAKNASKLKNKHKTKDVEMSVQDSK